MGASARSNVSAPWYERAWDGVKTDASDLVSRVFMVPVEVIMSVFVGSSGGWGSAHQTVTGAANALSAGNPLIMFMEAGQLMLTIAGGLILIWVGAKVVGALGGGAAAAAGAAALGPLGAVVAGAVEKVVEGFFAIAATLIFAFLVGGFVLGILLPALPLIAFLSAAMGWLLLVAEAMVAAPLWAAAHVSFEGEGWAPQRAQMGYQMVAGLVLRPILITIGAFLAMALMEAAAWLIGISFLGYASAYINGTQSMTQALEADGLVIILIMMLTFVSLHAVKVMTVLPDQVLKWIGGGTSALGAAADMQGHVNKVLGIVNIAKPSGAKKKPAASGGGVGEAEDGGLEVTGKEDA